MRCRVCQHADSAAIEAAAAVRSTTDVAIAFGLSELALERHLEQHPRASAVSLDPIEDAPATLRSSRLGEAA